jgi:hypothetical protein
MLAAGGCAEMPMFNQSGIVRHTDIQKLYEKPMAGKWLRIECKILS